MGIRESLAVISSHPLTRDSLLRTLWRVGVWQTKSRLMNGPFVVPFVNKSKLLASRGMFAATGNIYLGLQEFEEMSFLLHYLRPGDTFVDVGANIGSYTMLASAVTGAKTIAFEPVSTEFSALEANVALNDIKNLVDLRKTAVGSKTGTVNFTKGWGAGSKIIRDDEEGTSTSITTLDAAIDDKNIRLIKVDVEGFESEVIKGALRVLSGPSPLALIIELIGLAGYELGIDIKSIHSMITDLGFVPFEYNGLTRELVQADSFNKQGNNTLYLKGISEIRERIRTGPVFEVVGKRL